jgi:AcrR family transcriptional regulator
MATIPVRVSALHRKRQILAVATRLFAQQGFSGTTTRQIAERAKVNEALVFRHFPTKEGLYWDVLEAKIREAAPVERIEETLASGLGLEVFERVAFEILERRAKDDTLSRLLIFSGLENHKLARRFFGTYVADYYDRLAYHIERLMQAGELRRTDPLLAARAFLGMVVYHSWIQDLFGGKHFYNYPLNEASHTLAEIWLQGMRPEKIAAKRVRNSSNGDTRNPAKNLKIVKGRNRVESNS